MRLLLVFAVLILTQGAQGKAALLKGSGIALSHGGIIPFGPKMDFLSMVVIDISSRGVELDPPDSLSLSRLGYKLEFSDGSEETLGLVFQDGGTVKLLHHSSDEYPVPVDSAGTWSAGEWSQQEELDIDVVFGDEQGPRLKIYITLGSPILSAEGVSGEIKIPDLIATIHVVSSPSQGARDVSTYERNFSSLLDLNSLRKTDNSANLLAKELLGY